MWKTSFSRSRRGLSLIELVCTVALIALALGLVRFGFLRVTEQRQRSAARAYMAAIDAAKLEWLAQHPEAMPETEPPEAAIVELLSANGRNSLGSLEDLAASTGGRVFFI